MKRKFDFEFKQFGLVHGRCGMKIGTDGVLLGAWASECQSVPVRIADIGAGSGLIGLMLAQRMPLAEVDCVEIEDGAYADLCLNIEDSPFAARVRALHGDFAAYTPPGPLDLLVSNPPYFTGGLSAPDISRARARHQSEGLTYQALINRAGALLASDGRLAMVSPVEAEDEITWHATMARLSVRRLCRVAPVEGREATRLLWELSAKDGPLQRQYLAIRKRDNSYSNEYADLTRQFYLHF